MIFKNRYEAGKKLVPLLIQFKNNPNTIVIGLPRGGVITAYEVAQGLNLPLDVTCPRKIGAPFNPELAIGAITEAGIPFLNNDLIQRFGISGDYIHEAMGKEEKIAKSRVDLFRKNQPPLEVQGKTVILVDDGLATGSTMKAAIESMKKSGAGKVVVAVPMGPPETLNELKLLVYEVFYLDAPPFFRAVGEFYEDFSQTEDNEVIDLLKKTNFRNL